MDAVEMSNNVRLNIEYWSTTTKWMPSHKPHI